MQESTRTRQARSVCALPIKPALVPAVTIMLFSGCAAPPPVSDAEPTFADELGFTRMIASETGVGGETFELLLDNVGVPALRVRSGGAEAILKRSSLSDGTPALALYTDSLDPVIVFTDEVMEFPSGERLSIVDPVRARADLNCLSGLGLPAARVFFVAVECGLLSAPLVEAPPAMGVVFVECVKNVGGGQFVTSLAVIVERLAGCCAPTLDIRGEDTVFLIVNGKPADRSESLSFDTITCFDLLRPFVRKLSARSLDTSVATAKVESVLTFNRGSRLPVVRAVSAGSTRVEVCAAIWGKTVCDTVRVSVFADPPIAPPFIPPQGINDPGNGDGEFVFGDDPP